MLEVPSANVLPKIMENPNQYLCTAARQELYTILRGIEGHLPSSLRIVRPSTRVTHTDVPVTMDMTAINPSASFIQVMQSAVGLCCMYHHRYI